MSRHRILFVAEAATLAHVARLVTLANATLEAGMEVCFACDPRYAAVLGPLRYPVQSIWSLPSERFFRALAHGSVIFDYETLCRYAEEELALFARVKPDAVVGDFRLSLGASARHAGIPYINVTNAYWSPHARIRHVVPEYAPVRWTGAALGTVLFRLFRRIGFALHAQPVNRLRRHFGLPSLGSDFRRLMTDGDATCFADLPGIVPLERLEAHQRFLGPVHWSPPVPLPAWWPEVLAQKAERPLVYANLGSSGPAGALQTVLDALEGLPVSVVAATSGRTEKLRVTDNAWLADLLPGHEICGAASVVLCNGGSPAAYQALAAGAAVIGVASNMDQFLNMTAMEGAGCGLLLRSASLSVPAVRKTVEYALTNREMHSRAREVGHRLAGLSAPALFLDRLSAILDPGAKLRA